MNALGTKKGDGKDDDEKKKGSEGIEKIGYNHPSMPEHLPSSGTYLLTYLPTMNRRLMGAVTNDFTRGRMKAEAPVLDRYLQIPRYLLKGGTT